MQNGRNKSKVPRNAAAIFLLILGLAGCSGESGSNQARQGSAGGTVHLVYIDRAEAVVLTHLAKVVIQDRMGYKVEMVMADVPEAFSSVAHGDNDAFLDAWLPVTQKIYVDKYAKDLVDLGPTYEGARIGLVVPDFVTIDSIALLNDYRERFAAKIIGVESGAGIMEATDKAIGAYGLDYVLMPSSDASLTSSIESAFTNNEWVVVTGWKPHWMWKRWKLKFLDDPKKVYGERENIDTVVNRAFPERMPRVTQFLRNLRLSDEQMTALLEAAEENPSDPGQGVRIWLSTNEPVVKGWVPLRQPASLPRPDQENVRAVGAPSPWKGPESAHGIAQPTVMKTP